MPGRERREPKAISVADLERLLAACDDSPVGLRNEAMFRFLADTGCRVAGMLGLKRANLYLDQGYAVVSEKFSRDRAVPFIASTADTIRKWLSERPLEGNPGFAVAVTFSGDEIKVGIVGVELDRDDWLIVPGPVEQMIADKVA